MDWPMSTMAGPCGRFLHLYPFLGRIVGPSLCPVIRRFCVWNGLSHESLEWSVVIVFRQSFFHLLGLV